MVFCCPFRNYQLRSYSAYYLGIKTNRKALNVRKSDFYVFLQIPSNNLAKHLQRFFHPVNRLRSLFLENRKGRNPQAFTQYKHIRSNCHYILRLNFEA